VAPKSPLDVCEDAMTGTITAAWVKRRVIHLAIGVTLGLAAGGVLLRLNENRIVFPAPHNVETWASPSAFGLEAEEVWLTTSDGVRLNGWLFPHPGSPRVLLSFHGNAENLGMTLERMKVLSSLGLNLFALDYRGYGKSAGSPDEAGVYRDADAAYRYLTAERGFRPQDIIIHGQSIGGAVAIDLASRVECGGLIAESTFTTLREMAFRTLLIPLYAYVAKSEFKSSEKISAVRAPILIIHGKRDQLIPFSMGERLYALAPQPKTFAPLELAGHNDVLLVDRDVYLDRLREFVTKL
jgi:fermentation-respiration switch protein FrsA (DUF1100 family)